MKWNFRSYSTGISHEGAGEIEVGYEKVNDKYEVFLNVNFINYIDSLFCETESEALRMAKRIYLDFIKYRLAKTLVLYKNEKGIEIININTGQSQWLSNSAVAKLKGFIK